MNTQILSVLDGYFSSIQSELQQMPISEDADKNYKLGENDNLYIQYINKDVDGYHFNIICFIGELDVKFSINKLTITVDTANFEKNKIYRAIIRNGKVSILKLVNDIGRPSNEMEETVIKKESVIVENKKIDTKENDNKLSGALLKTSTVLLLTYFFNSFNALIITKAFSMSKILFLIKIANENVVLDVNGSVSNIKTHERLNKLFDDTNLNISLPDFTDPTPGTSQSIEIVPIKKTSTRDLLYRKINYHTRINASRDINSLIIQDVGERTPYYESNVNYFLTSDSAIREQFPIYFHHGIDKVQNSIKDAYLLAEKAVKCFKYIHENLDLKIRILDYFSYFGSSFFKNQDLVLSNTKSCAEEIMELLKSIIDSNYKDIYLYSTHLLSKENPNDGSVKYSSAMLKCPEGVRNYINAPVAFACVLQGESGEDLNNSIVFFLDKFISHDYTEPFSMVETILHEVSHHLMIPTEDMIDLITDPDTGNLVAAHDVLTFTSKMLEYTIYYVEKKEKFIEQGIENSLYKYLEGLFLRNGLTLNNESIREFASYDYFDQSLMTINADHITLHIRELAKIFDELKLI